MQYRIVKIFGTTFTPKTPKRLSKWIAASLKRLPEYPKTPKPQNPKIGPAGIMSGTREIIPHSSYRLVYQLDPDVIWIMALVHTARAWPFPG